MLLNQLELQLNFYLFILLILIALKIVGQSSQNI